MNKPIIEVENISKRYRLGAIKEPYLSLRDEIIRFASRLRTKSERASNEDFWALKDISFRVQEGEAIGIIGRNGAGKSTLLKILSQITPPTQGYITMRGRVASLLEVGTGFHPELTGRENIFLNGAILGMTREEIRRKFDQIVDFAEVEKFLDTPVKRYSSGMYVRLAFAVAAHLEPEILVVDEVLAVGDHGFQKKCLGKMGEVAKGGRTVLFVSHNMSAIRNLCTESILLEHGKIALKGSSDLCIEKYIESATQRTGTILSHGKQKSTNVAVNSITVNNVASDCIDLSGTAESLQIKVSCLFKYKAKVNIEAELICADGTPIGIYKPGHYNNDTLSVEPGAYEIETIISIPKLLKGNYLLSIYITNPTIEGYWDFPYAVELRSEGWPMSLAGSLFANCQAGSVIFTGSTRMH